MIKEFKTVIYDSDKEEKNKELGIDAPLDEEIVPVCIDMDEIQGYVKAYLEFEGKGYEAVLVYLKGGNRFYLFATFKEFDASFRKYKSEQK